VPRAGRLGLGDADGEDAVLEVRLNLLGIGRRNLVVTAETEFEDTRSQILEFAAEIAALGFLALVLALSIHLLRRSAAQQP
jgi:hypothetical protein